MAWNRVRRLKDLADRLERLPASSERDRVLSEIRSRAVDLDTGVTPRAMLPVREPVPAPVAPRPPKRHQARSITYTAPAPVVGPVHAAFAAGGSHDLERSLCVDERLSLEDSPLPRAGNRAVAPWRLGLRG